MATYRVAIFNANYYSLGVNHLTKDVFVTRMVAGL